VTRRRVEVLIEFECDAPSNDQLDDLCSEAETLVDDILPTAHSILADVVLDEEVGG
jgi:hypothetical protein